MEKQRDTEISDWYQLHGDAVLSFILIMVRDYQLAEDLTQETFVKAYRFFESFNYQSNEKTWLFTIARNITFDYMRKKKPIQLLKEMFMIKKDETPSPEEFVLMKEDSKELYLALSKMKTNYKEVIVLRKIKGFSIEETCKILQWSESKVKITLHRALSELENRLKRSDFQ
ncbi:RNA polymerase sigma factor [Halalkalibacter akibai]|uniref:RNA polymerase sigma factor n=1 Tax=Halalkalibacter akibai (strain ATCC 43226 / DSM 21942 / CIP 109018 / JCM 9157 / 1139) TaxID=1236973 RepID=W4QZX9_HALA3|nr:RNA polymerase sigma factor [Halalkalibacter akibai]GAE37437.1 RNA polymerase sigma-70 factor [Halalkalibacter akibai JCM 9157]